MAKTTIVTKELLKSFLIKCANVFATQQEVADVVQETADNDSDINYYATKIGNSDTWYEDNIAFDTSEIIV
jgi:hypothetical protein